MKKKIIVAALSLTIALGTFSAFAKTTSTCDASNKNACYIGTSSGTGKLIVVQE